MILQEDNYREIINSYKADDWKPLLDLIPQIEEKTAFGKFIKGTVSEEGVHTMPFIMQHDVVSRFSNICYEIPVMVNFDWGSWREGRDILDDASFDFDTIDIPDKCRLITTILRANRFSEGYLVSAFESGVVLKILKSIHRQLHSSM